MTFTSTKRSDVRQRKGSEDSIKPSTDTVVFPSGFVFRHFLHEDANISKLFTREDPNHIHKILGLLSICSFVYRYGYCYNAYGTLGFDGPTSSVRSQVIDWVTMVIHISLACSSILFRVPKKRINDKPMIIYEEYRQHAMVFTLRSFDMFALLMVFPGIYSYAVFVIVMLHHVWVDYITSKHGTEGNTAVRTTADKVSSFYKMVSKFYSLYQFLAIGALIFPTARHIDMCYNAIIAIQSSAFMMTLYRKRIVRGKTHMAVYSFCLLLSAFHILRELGIVTCGLVVAAFLLRINLPRAWSNKYVIWTLIFCVYNYLKFYIF